jgi:alpha-mannosidase
MNTKLLIYLFLAFGMNLLAQQTTVIVKNTNPIKYEKKGGRLKVLSYIKLTKNSKKPVKATCDGVELKLISTPSPDSILVWLPLIGDRNELKLYSGSKQLIVDQIFEPLIPKDWGYFQNGTIHIIQSTHQDIAWIDTPDYCRKDRIENIILPALELMKKDKNFTFEMEQTLNLMEFLDAHPEKRDEVLQRFKEKRFFWGATYNQPYEGLQSGEQLVRQTYYGRKWIRDNFPGCDDLTANNMDVPGRSLQFPQILAKSGVENLCVSRLREGLYDWSSPDGSKVHTFSPGNYGWTTMFWKFFNDDAVTAFNKLHHRSELWSDYFRQHHIPADYAILVSCDATKPVNYKNVIDEWNSIVDQAEVPLPRLKNTTSDEYFEKINVAGVNFEKISGERPNLWIYIHGPAHYEATLAKREAGVLLPAAESFTTFNELMNHNLQNYPKSLFDKGWIASIYPDHGLGGKNGNITDSIYQDSLMLGRDLGKKLLDSALVAITKQVDAKRKSVVVFNDLTWPRTDMVLLDIEPALTKDIVVKDEKGNIRPTQIIRQNNRIKVAFIAENVPALGYKTYTLSKGRVINKIQPDVKQLSNYYENQYYKIVLGNGGIESLFDKSLQKELLITSKFKGGDIIEAGYTGNGAGEFTQIKPIETGDLTSLGSNETTWSIVESGPLYTAFENVQPGKNARIIQRIKIYHSLKKIDFDITLADFNGAHNRQFRMALPLNMKEKKICYEVPMGIVEVGKDEMKTVPGGWSWDGTYNQLPEDAHPREIQNFISASGNGFGVTMSSCVAAADWIDPSREIADYPVLQGILLSSHKSCHWQGNWYDQKGTHQFTFSITSHQEGWKNGYNFGIAANHPLIAIEKENNGGILEKEKSFMTISNPFVALSVVKKADKDHNIIIRLTEMKGEDTSVKIDFPFAVKKVIKTNLIEDEKEVIETSGKSIILPIGHNAIETYKLVF